MRRVFRDATRLERDSRAERDFHHQLIAQMQRELEDAKHARDIARSELERVKTSSTASPMSAPSDEARAAGTVTEGREAGADAGRAEASGTRVAAGDPGVSGADVGALSRALSDVERLESERARLEEELEETKEQLRSATASAHRANAECNAMAHQSRAAVGKERRRVEMAEARIRELEAAAAEMAAARRTEEDAQAATSAKERAEDKTRASLTELEDALATSTAEVEALKLENETLSERVRALQERSGGDLERSDSDEEGEERGVVTRGSSYADEAVVALRKAALSAHTLAKSYHARLYPEGEPARGEGRILVVIHASLEGHPFADARRDVTQSLRSRVRAQDGKRLVILVSENISDLVPDESPGKLAIETKLAMRNAEDARQPASLRVTYAFDAHDAVTGSVTRGDERVIEIPIGAAGTRHAFAMQSVWIEASPTSVEDALKAAYSRLRDAETTASSAKLRAIALHAELIHVRQFGGSSARAQAIERRELDLERREAELAAEIAEIEIALARARDETAAVRREAHRAVADANVQLRVKEDEIERLRAVQTARARARDRSKSWRRDDAAASRAPDSTRAESTRDRIAAADTLANAQARLERLINASKTRTAPA